MPIASYDPMTGDILGRKRALYEIFADVVALTAQQRANLWDDLNVTVDGVSRYLTGEGINPAAIFSMDWTAQLGPDASGQRANAQNCIMAMWIQDMPRYAVHPPWDPSIDIPGFVPDPPA